MILLLQGVGQRKSSCYFEHPGCSSQQTFFPVAGGVTCFDVDSTLQLGFVILAIVTQLSWSA